jgi:hypothetical protein
MGLPLKKQNVYSFRDNRKSNTLKKFNGNFKNPSTLKKKSLFVQKVKENDNLTVKKKSTKNNKLNRKMRGGGNFISINSNYDDYKVGSGMKS